jgi:hypothetical protein
VLPAAGADWFSNRKFLEPKFTTNHRISEYVEITLIFDRIFC